MTEHDLKTWPGPFAAVLAGTKRHEIRKADRLFAVGDVLHLREWVPEGILCSDGPFHVGKYTGRDLRVRVTHLTHGGEWGLPVDVCVMSIEPVAPPLTVGAALALPEVQDGTHELQASNGGFSPAIRIVGDELRWQLVGGRPWRDEYELSARMLAGRVYSWPCRLVPLASADADPSTRGPIGGDRG